MPTHHYAYPFLTILNLKMTEQTNLKIVFDINNISLNMKNICRICMTTLQNTGILIFQSSEENQDILSNRIMEFASIKVYFCVSTSLTNKSDY